jgi:transposase-like protein
VKKVFGENAVIHRCQVHKIHNAESHNAARHQAVFRRRINEAYAQVNHADAKQLLLHTVIWLKTINSVAAASLKEGLDETITVIRPGLEGELKRFFGTTNAIESTLLETTSLTSKRNHDEVKFQPKLVTQVSTVNATSSRFHGVIIVSSRINARPS